MMTHITRTGKSLAARTLIDLQGDFRKFPDIIRGAFGGFVTTQTVHAERLEALEKRVGHIEERLSR